MCPSSHLKPFSVASFLLPLGDGKTPYHPSCYLSLFPFPSLLHLGASDSSSRLLASISPCRTHTRLLHDRVWTDVVKWENKGMALGWFTSQVCWHQVFISNPPEWWVWRSFSSCLYRDYLRIQVRLSLQVGAHDPTSPGKIKARPISAGKLLSEVIKVSDLSLGKSRG